MFRGLGFRVLGLKVLGFRGLGFRGLRFWGLGFRVLGVRVFWFGAYAVVMDLAVSRSSPRKPLSCKGTQQPCDGTYFLGSQGGSPIRCPQPKPSILRQPPAILEAKL